MVLGMLFENFKNYYILRYVIYEFLKEVLGVPQPTCLVRVFCALPSQLRSIDRWNRSHFPLFLWCLCIRHFCRLYLVYLYISQFLGKTDTDNYQWLQQFNIDRISLGQVQCKLGKCFFHKTERSIILQTDSCEFIFFIQINLDIQQYKTNIIH